MRKFKILALLMVLVLSFSAFVGCDGGPQTGVDPTTPGKNTDNSFSMMSTWTASGLVNHYNSNTNCGAYDYFVVEGLYRYVRSTDEIFCQLAAELPVHTEHPIAEYKDAMGADAYDYYIEQGCETVSVSRCKIRENATWQNGEPFTAKDIWSYYYMMHPTSSNYMVSVVVVDDKTVEFVWNPLKEPADTVKVLLLAQDKSGTVKYDEFSSYVDTLYDIVMASPVNNQQNLWGAFNRFSTDEQVVKMNVTRNAFSSYSPSWYIATGPFKPDTFSATQIGLVKNEFYWNADAIGFDKVKLYTSSDLNQTYQLITNGYVDYYDGFIQQDTLESMIATNEDLINLKMYDPGSIGITFNIKSGLFSDIRIRKAFQYIFDREEITLAANPYATTSYYPLMGMADSEAQRYMSKKHYDTLPKYSFNRSTAETLLKEAGWTLENGRWMKGGKEVTVVLGAPASHDISSTAAEAAAAQMESFGIKVNLLKSSSFYSNAMADNCPYDMMLEWTDLNMSFSYPTGSYNQFAGVYASWVHVDKYPVDYYEPAKRGSVKLVFNGLDGDTKTYEFADYINSFYSVDAEELTYLVDVFNHGLADLSLGIQFFQNVTASTYNVGKIKNVPMQKYWQESRNVEYVPGYGTEEFFEVARTNLPFAQNYLLIDGTYQPNN